MRSLILTLVVALILGSVFVSSSVAQQPTGPVTLGNVPAPDEAPSPTAAPEAKAADAGAVRPAGTLVRPKDGVQHPDLDKAWKGYEAAVANATESIKAAIAKQHDAAAATGKLELVEKWEAIEEKFRNAGELPAEGEETKAAVRAAVADYKSAKDELAKTYESVVKGLTMEKKIPEAKAVRAEWAALVGGGPKQPIVAAVPGPQQRRQWLLGIWILSADIEAHAKADGSWTETNRNNGLLHATGTWGGPDAEGFFKVRLSNGWTVFIHPTAQDLADVKYTSPAGKPVPEDGSTGVIKKKGAR